MVIAIRVLSDGQKRAVRCKANASLKELKKWGLRLATEDEKAQYWALKSSFNKHEISEIIVT